MEPSVYTRIIKGELPSHKLYEDEYALAFLDIHPAVKGQAVVVSKKQVEFVWDLEEADYRGLMDAVRKVARRLQEVLKTKYVGVRIEGTEVPHSHVKIYPFNTEDEYHAKQDMSEPDRKALDELAKQLSV